MNSELPARDAGLIVMANLSTHEPSFATWEPHPEPNTRVDPKGKVIHFFEAEDLAALLPQDRFEILSSQGVDLFEIPDGGPVTHREWLAIARKICPRGSPGAVFRLSPAPNLGMISRQAAPNRPATPRSGQQWDPGRGILEKQ